MGRSEQIVLGEAALADAKDRAICDEQFAELVARQSTFVFRLAHAVLRNAHDAEDVVQEVFLKVHRSWKNWHKVKEERAYLARAAWRAALERRPKRSDSNIGAYAFVSKQENPEQAALHRNWSAVVHHLLDTLPEDLRLPLVLSAIEELKSSEIADLLGIPEGTVRTRVMKARSVLRQKLTALKGAADAK
jgi:RNA polymerase sigma-70 factor (ECF subfamily)